MKYSYEQIHYPAEDLLTRFLVNLRHSNPHIKIGETMKGPSGFVWQGKLVERNPIIEAGTPVYTLDHAVPHIEPPKVDVRCQGIKIHLKDYTSPEWGSFNHKWLYPYTITIPHAEWLKAHVPGDTVLVFDDEFDASPYTLTEKDFQDHAYMIFRFAVSD